MFYILPEKNPYLPEIRGLDIGLTASLTPSSQHGQPCLSSYTNGDKFSNYSFRWPLQKKKQNKKKKRLLQTITKRQLRALSQIAHNCITFRIKLIPTEKPLLKRERRLLYIFGNITFGHKGKKETSRGKQGFIYNENSFDLFEFI